jgi:hypothetical protein
MNKKAENNLISGFVMVCGISLIVLGELTWQPIAYFGVLITAIGIAIRYFMGI